MAHPGTWSGRHDRRFRSWCVPSDHPAGPAASAEPSTASARARGLGDGLRGPVRYSLRTPASRPTADHLRRGGGAGPSFLAVHPAQVEGADAGRLAITYGARFEIIGEVPADGAEDARVFFSYDGP